MKSRSTFGAAAALQLQKTRNMSTMHFPISVAHLSMALSMLCIAILESYEIMIIHMNRKA